MWKHLTWSKCLGVPNSNKAIVVHFSLRGKSSVNQPETVTVLDSSTLKSSAATYTDGGIFVQLVFGCNSKTRAVAAGGPSQIDSSLQAVAHFLVDRASKFRAIVALERSV